MRPTPNESLARQRFAFRDGGETHYFEFVRALTPTPSEAESWIFVFPGSGCASIGSHLRPTSRRTRGRKRPPARLRARKAPLEPKIGCAAVHRSIRSGRPSSPMAIGLQRVRRSAACAPATTTCRTGGNLRKRGSRATSRPPRSLMSPMWSYSRSPERIARCISTPSGGYRMAGADEGFFASLAGHLHRTSTGPWLPARSYRYWGGACGARHAREPPATANPHPNRHRRGGPDGPRRGWLSKRRDLARAQRTSLADLAAFANADPSSGRKQRKATLPDFWHNVDLWLAR